MRNDPGFVRMAFRRSPIVIGMMLLSMGLGEASPMQSIPEHAPADVTVLGAHTLLVQPDGEGTDPAIAGPIDTRDAGSALLVLVGGYVSNAAPPSDTYANTWAQQGPSIAYQGYRGRFQASAYVALPARGGKDHRVILPKHGAPAGEITAPFVEIRNAGVLQDVAARYAVPDWMARIGRKLSRGHSEAALTSGSVTTTGPATLVAVWWGDAFVYRMTAVPDNGFQVIERFLELPPNSGVQCAVAVRQVDRAGTWRVTWRGTPAQGAILWLFAFQAGG